MFEVHTRKMAVVELDLACSLQSYCECVPQENQWKLNKQIDFEHDGVPTHLGAIADAMDEWEGRVAEGLELSLVDVSAIKAKHPDSLNLQTREALHRWQEKKGLVATYQNLIGAFLKAGKTSYAEAVCKVLGMNSKIENASSVSVVSDVAEARSSTNEVTVEHDSTGSHQEVAPRKKSYDDEKKELLKKNLAKIKQSFASLKRQVLQTLQEKDINLQVFVDFVMGLITPSECIQDAKEIVTIFQIITKNLLWSYSEYDMLKIIAEGFAKDDTEQLIDSYERELASFYATTRLVDYIALCQDEEDLVADPDEPLAPNPAKYNSAYFQKLTIKIGRRVTNETLQYIADLWKAVSKFFVLPPLMALLDRVVAGSLTVSWFIPHHFAMQIIANFTESVADTFFRAHQITEVNIEDECLYHCETTATDTKLALLKACREGNLDKVLELLEAISDFDFSEYDDTPLMAAATIDIVQVLLLYPFDINGRDKNGATALMVASHKGQTDVVELLLKHNANVNARTEDGWTALMSASEEGKTDVVELLLKHNADVNARKEDGWTALMVASHKGQTDVVELLLKHNANVNAWKKDGWTALMVASHKGQTDVVELLLKHNADVNARMEDGWTALMSASQKGQTDVVELLLKHNADVNARKEDGWTALMSASQKGQTDVVELLLKHNADVNASTEETKWTSLFFASKSGHVEIVQLLVEYGAEVVYRDKNGITALDTAQTYNHTEVSDLLMAVNRTTETGVLNEEAITHPPAQLSEETRKHVVSAGDYNQKLLDKQKTFFKKITDFLLPERARKREVVGKHDIDTKITQRDIFLEFMN